ncbi:hypothetical protein N7509_012433 [Penicillium cosmopolitanum]|uniref:Uncharacterized protein n=1 Tax=Penicillium cosmopolitanum TaxID=1131564 RepID=A0A9W9VFX9_9EURO|nr:uncharacterized protein N7509_012433 [Penicillium cosmopolitanum]KAJ5379314.1 hypothetical protein N7509_012433 [Penicillium cosmopolitanum]
MGNIFVLESALLARAVAVVQECTDDNNPRSLTWSRFMIRPSQSIYAPAYATTTNVPYYIAFSTRKGVIALGLLYLAV